MYSTYSAHENKLRLYSESRLDSETYARVKAAGFTWAPKQECFIAAMWTPAREDLLLELCDEIDDEDITLEERAQERAERFDGYSEKRQADAEAAHKAVEAITKYIEPGQPILVGHHSEAHARRDAKRIQDGMRKAVNLWDTAQYWQHRAAAALRHAKYKERPDVRARRIKTLGAEQRKITRTQDEARAMLAMWTKDGLTMERALFITNHSGYDSYCFPLADYPREPPASQYEGSMSLWSALSGGVITYEQARDLAVPSYQQSLAHCARWLAHLANRLAYERALLADAGGTVADQNRPEVGGACRCWASHKGGWSYMTKVNKVTVTVLDNWGNGGKNFTRTIPFDKLTAVMTRQAVEQLRAEGRLIEHADGTGFFRTDTPPPTAPEPAPAPQPEAYSAMQEQLKAGVQVTVVEELFPTPAELADRMVRLADVKPGERILEPSAGTGALLDAIGRVPCFSTDEASGVLAIEKHEGLSLLLAKRRELRTTYTYADFLSIDPQGYEPFDVVLMNPPFSAQVAHVTHATSFLKPGGRLVAVMSSGVTFHSTKEAVAFRAMLEQYGGHITPLPADTFKESGTGVCTVLVSLTVPALQETPAPEPEPAQTLEALAAQIETQAEQSEKRLARERLELAWQSKKQSTKPQAAPCGLFAQEQGALL